MENQNLPIYRVVVNEDTSDETGVYKVSFVDQPAIESNFVYLSTEKKPIELTGEPLKQLVTGAVLIPDKPIFRKDNNDDEYNIYFTEEDIFKIVKKFFKQKLTDQTNIQHLIPVDGNYVIESWIVSDSNKDKSVSLGLDKLPIGTWVLTYHVPDQQLFSKIVSGELKGFSIEAILNLIQMPNLNFIKNKNQKSMKKGLLNKVFSFFKELEIEEYKTKDGKTLTVDGTTGIASVEEKPITKGEYELEDGSIIVVNDQSVTTDIKAPVAESISKEEKKEVAEVVEVLSDDKKKVNELTSKFSDLEKKLSDLTTENTKLKIEVEKLSKLPAANPISTAPVIQKEWDKMSTAERITYNIEKLTKAGVIK